MGTQEGKLARLSALNAEIQRADPALAEERRALTSLELLELPSGEGLASRIQEESIVLRRARPVLAIRENEVQLDFVDQADSAIWKARLEKAAPFLTEAARAVGRVDLQGGPLDWIGTGWLVSEAIIVTNRHVANEFAVRKGQGLTFRIADNGPMTASVDFLQEIDNPKTLTFKLTRPLLIQEAPGPDVAFFEVEPTSGSNNLARAIVLSNDPRETESAATIGYPAYDSRIPEPDLMEQIYGGIYNKKRIAPGALTRVEDTQVWHNCTTLGGNSGSVLLDLTRGEAIGLHFSGSFLTTNYAVRSDVVKRLLAEVRSGRTRSQPQSRSLEIDLARQAQLPMIGTNNSNTFTATIPLTVTVSIGQPSRMLTIQAARDSDHTPSLADSAFTEDETEAVASDYGGRNGYSSSFLGAGFSVKLPKVIQGAADVVSFEDRGKTSTLLKYQHYSVVMSKARRMCFFSAVNINGKLSKKSARVAWKWDPRIPREAQIMKECYGDPPKFSRGHMTRREDPGWGDAVAAKLGNEDSMHVTNVTPQMQAFNSPIWLALEDYALGHARQDEMKISVFTGPYFIKNDPTMYGVRIPRSFWKIIAFIHDETGELCATGYEMNQEQSLQPEEEFVFGSFISPQLGIATQVSVRSIEMRSGLSFKGLANADPLNAQHESVDPNRPPSPLMMLEHIRFI